MAKNPFGDTPIGETNPFGDTPINKTSPFQMPKEDKVGFGKNLYRTIGGALRDVASGTLDVMALKEKFSPIELTKAYAQAKASGDSSVSNILGTALQQENPLNIAAKSIPKVEEPDYFGGSLARDVLGFSIPAAPISKLAAPLQAATLGQKLLKGAAVGSVAEQFAFSPYEERISNIIQDNPSLQNSITEFLQADPNDNEAEARLKMAVEGSAIGIPFDALLRAIGKGYSKIKTNQVTEQVDTFVGPKNPFGDTPVTQPKAETVVPEVVTPKAETPKRGTKIPEILQVTKKPKVRMARDYIGKVSDESGELKDIFEDSSGKIQRKFKPGEGEKGLNLDGLDEVQARMQADGFYNQVETELNVGQSGSSKFDMSDQILEDLNSNTIHRDDQLLLSNWEKRTDEAKEFRKLLDDNNINYRGMTDEEVLQKVDDINNNRIPPVRDEVPIEVYEGSPELLQAEDMLPSRFIEEVDRTPPDFAGNINLNKIDSPDQVKNVIDEIAENNDGFIDARRGVVKFGSDGEELKALAKETKNNMNIQLINNKRIIKNINF